MLTLRAPAKINLTLEVLSRRDDGYHGIRSVMVPLELADELTIAASAAFRFTCDRRELENESNLVVAALRSLGELPPVEVELRKRIPLQAGLGGGSSDAAAMLKAAMEGAFGPSPRRDWLRLARALGSDVPFFLAGTAALVEGTGERVTPAGTIARWHVLVIKPPVAISTAAAYEALDRRPPAPRPRNASVSIALLAALQRDDFAQVESLMHNDFQETIAVVPEIAAALAALRAAGASNALLAGSGSCVFTVSPNAAAIRAAAARLALPPEYQSWVTAFAASEQWR